MKIYISGISGTGMGPLALMAKQAGAEVSGSDESKGAIYDELVEAGIDVYIGEQDGEFLRQKLDEGVDWFVYTSALSSEHPELKIAREVGVKVSKRDELTAFLVKRLGLKMIAVAGTHGKTTTTSMIVFAALRLGLPVSYIVGTTLGFAKSGAYHRGDKYFVYEADEYDRNFLKFSPWLAVVTCVSYDHPDIYPTREDYAAAFRQFENQSEEVVKEAVVNTSRFRLAGEARRVDAALALEAVKRIANDYYQNTQMLGGSAGGVGSAKRPVEDVDGGVHFINRIMTDSDIIEVLNDFPGAGRRFERLAKGIYTDYAHHPEEIVATLDMAHDEAERCGYKGVVAVYQPHQNIRQYEVHKGYYNAFEWASKIYWLPTYLTREDPSLEVLTPEDLIYDLENSSIAEPAEMNDKLFNELMGWANKGYLVILMAAGPADAWLREKVARRLVSGE